MSDTQTFIFAFSEEGFESIINLTAMDMAFIQAKMADEKLPQQPGNLVHMLELRARYNAQRKMEVWVLGVDQGLTEEDLWGWAENDPQSLANALRERGHAIYGAEYHSKKKVIE